MPSVSRAQARAMFAAKAGHSTLGIPQSVGAEYAAATPSVKALPKKVGTLRKKHAPKVVIARRKK